MNENSNYPLKNPEELAQKVRLKPWEIAVIQQAFTKTFLPQDHLWLFGSRVDLTKRGGDIDLYIETIETDMANQRNLERQFYIHLIKELGDQKIDIVIKSNNTNSVIDQEAQQTGVQLV